MFIRKVSLVALLVFTLGAAAHAGPMVLNDHTFSVSNGSFTTNDGVLALTATNPSSAGALVFTDIITAVSLGDVDGANPTAPNLQEAVGVGELAYGLPSAADNPMGGSAAIFTAVTFTLAPPPSDNYPAIDSAIHQHEDGPPLPNPGISPAPIPSAALLGVLGLGMVGWIKKRFEEQVRNPHHG